MPPLHSTLVTIATYNEIENLPSLVAEIWRIAPAVEILVIDDNSPDGTGRWCDDMAARDERFHVVHRAGKLGLGTATVEAMRYATERGYGWMLNMDADFSHHPRYLPEIIRLAQSAENPIDVVIGSRYVSGGGVDGWPLSRRLMSRCVNLYARIMLGLKTRDCSGAYRCYNTDILRRIDLSGIRSRGYSFLEEVLWLLKRADATFRETPIIFTDREKGQSKINSREAIAALWILFRLGLKNWLRI